jgi:HAE1 family hydrophobic/amphiphilic exporter-1
MVTHQKAVAAIIGKDPNVESYMSVAGGGGGQTNANAGRVIVRLKPRSQRKLSADDVIRELQPKLARVPGIRAYLQNPPSINVGARSSKSQYQFTLMSTDQDALYESSNDLLAKLRELPGLQDVTTDLQIANPQVDVAIDRERASALGVTAEQIEQALYDAYGSRQVSTIFTPNDQYWVIMELIPEFQRDLSALQSLYVQGRNGALVPLSAVARLTSDVGPTSVNHQGQIPAVTLSFNLQPGASLGQAVDGVQRAARETLPSSITTTFSGTAQVFQSSQQGLGMLLLLAVLVIYLVLGILYESFIHPLTILSGLPFAGFGALLTLMIFRTDLSIYAYVGIVLLIGLVKKNAIMMIDFALDAERNEGKSPRDAIVEACLIRFRPIMMTTMAALMGTLPIAVGFGAGAESRRPLGLAVVGGLAFSQIVTLYVTPVFYTYLDALQHRLGRRRRPPPELVRRTGKEEALKPESAAVG